MELSKKVKTALDETRILILGSQILVGFQFRGVFEDAFEQLPGRARYMDGIALMLMLVATGLLIAPSMRHRITAEGRDSGVLHGYVCTMAELALLPFALSLGLDLEIAMDRLFGIWGGAVAGTGFAALALLFWYGLEYARRRKTGHEERAVTAQQTGKTEPTPLHSRIEQMLTEARVVLPGAQALLGFQLAIVLTSAFDKLPHSSKLVHAASLSAIAVTVVLLMAPAAYHRIVYAGEDTEGFHGLGSRFVVAATVPLALGLAGDVYVVIAKIAESGSIGLAAAGLVLAMLVGLWHVFPVVLRRRRLPAIRRAEQREFVEQGRGAG